MGRIKPIVIDGEFTTIEPKATVGDLKVINPKAKSFSAINERTGNMEVVSIEDSQNRPLSDYSNLSTNLTDTVRGTV